MQFKTVLLTDLVICIGAWTIYAQQKDSWKSELSDFSSNHGYELNRNGDSAPLLLDVLEGFLKFEVSLLLLIPCEYMFREKKELKLTIFYTFKDHAFNVKHFIICLCFVLLRFNDTTLLFLFAEHDTEHGW